MITRLTKWHFTMPLNLQSNKETLKKFVFIGASLLCLVACNSTDFNRPKLKFENCTVFDDVSQAECLDREGNSTYIDAWGFRVVSVDDEKKITQYVLDLERCILLREKNPRETCRVRK